MTLIEGVGDEVTHFFIAFFAILLLCFAWWTTNISEQRHLRTVYLIERRLRRQRTHSRLSNLSNHTHTVSLVEASSSSEASAEVTASEDSMETQVTADEKPPEAGTSVAEVSANPEDEEKQAIVNSMDSDETCVLRKRRTAFYNDRKATIIDNNESTSAANSSGGNHNLDDNDSVQERVVMEHNYADQNNGEFADTGEVNESREPEVTDPAAIRIKLKYINDDLKQVDGHLEELLGDFKRRHFESEMSANKLVRLIFNGKVLQQDSDTLQSCGMFDNCVVHCLIHNKRNNATEDTNSGIGGEEFFRRNGRQSTAQTNNNQGRDVDLGNVLLALITLILGTAWYFRYVYAHLYTVTATIALVALTGIFTVVMIGMYFPDQEQPLPQQQSETATR